WKRIVGTVKKSMETSCWALSSLLTRPEKFYKSTRRTKAIPQLRQRVSFSSEGVHSTRDHVHLKMRPPGVNGAGDRKNSKSGRSVDPQDPGFGAPRVLPAVRGRAFEIEAITRLEKVAFTLIQADFEFTAQHVEEFLALMGIRFAAA